MRAREFIVEYKHDITKKNWFEKIWQRGMVDRSFTPHLHNMLKDEWLAYEQAKQDNDQERVQRSMDSMDQWVTTQIQALERADPSPNKQYVQWMLRLWTNTHGVSRIEDIISTTSEMLHKYHELKQRNKLPQELRDINRFQTSLNLEKLHDEVDRLYDLLNKADAAAMPKGNAREVWSDSNFRIIVPEDEAAACYYGQGTKWCTAATKGHNMFDHYSQDGSIYILIPKKPEYEGEKYQLHGPTRQVMNERDQPIYIKKLLTRFPALKQVLPKVATNHDFDDWTELLSDADINNGVGTWNAWANKQLQEWILPKLLTRWIAAHRGEFASPQQTYVKLSRAILDIAADSEVSLQDFYRTAERIHEKGDTAVTDIGNEFTRLMATTWREHLINTASSKYTGKNAPVSLENTEWDVMIKTLRDISGRLMDEDVTATYWSEDEGWEFEIFDYNDLEFADTENEEEP